MIPIVPAIIPKSLEHLESMLDRVSFATEVQIDVVDGRFVPFASWPYQPNGQPIDIKDKTDQFTLEVDLMVFDQVEAGKAWLTAGADTLVFHAEGIELEILKKFIADTSISIGVSALNDTPLDVFLPYVEVADYVQLMGIAEIGAQGQIFDERVLDRIKELKKIFPNLTISIDGSVNKHTIRPLCEAGADRLVSGSAIFSADDTQKAYEELVAKTN